MRSTRILGADKRITSYPNYKITESPIVNISSEPKRRVVVKLALSYDTGVDRLSRALEVLRSLPQSVEGCRGVPRMSRHASRSMPSRR